MTDNEIIKALECCGSPYNRCLECPLCETERVKCFTEMSANAIDLINRQKAEIERLKAIVDSFTDIGKLYSEIKAEAVKEFAERLCKDRVSNDPVVIAVKVELKTAGVDNG